MQGGSEFATDLTRMLRLRHTYSSGSHLPFTVDWIRVKSYEGTESTGAGTSQTAGTRNRCIVNSNCVQLPTGYLLCAVKIDGVDLKGLKGRDVIVVEDIIDTGA
jgi:hypoxanthine-guanine phosphoribosyltransferase